MTSLHTRLFGLIACIWGGVLLYFYHSTRVRFYLDIGFHQFILVGGVGILILGIYSIIDPKEKKARCSHDHDHDHHDHGSCDHDHEHDHHHGEHSHDDHCDTCDHDHGDGHGPFVTALLTLVPLFMAMSYTKDSFSQAGLAKKRPPARSISTTSSAAPFTRDDLEKNVPKNAYGEFEIRMITAYYAAGDPEIQGIFEGLPVELEGRINEETLNNAAGDRMKISRSIISCCAADMQVIDVALEFPEGAPRPSVDDWAKAGGTLTFETLGSDVYPVLKVREVVPTEEPYSEFQRRQ